MTAQNFIDNFKKLLQRDRFVNPNKATAVSVAKSYVAKYIAENTESETRAMYVTLAEWHNAHLHKDILPAIIAEFKAKFEPDSIDAACYMYKNSIDFIGEFRRVAHRKPESEWAAEAVAFVANYVIYNTESEITAMKLSLLDLHKEGLYDDVLPEVMRAFYPERYTIDGFLASITKMEVGKRTFNEIKKREPERYFSENGEFLLYSRFMTVLKHEIAKTNKYARMSMSDVVNVAKKFISFTQVSDVLLEASGIRCQNELAHKIADDLNEKLMMNGSLYKIVRNDCIAVFNKYVRSNNIALQNDMYVWTEANVVALPCFFINDAI